MSNSGLSALAAIALFADVADSFTAAGSTQLTAAETGTGVVIVTTAAASSGVLLDLGSRGDSQLIYNGGANAVAVYPPLGHTINQASANVSLSVPVGSMSVFYRVTQTRWMGGLIPDQALGSGSSPTFAALTVNGLTTTNSLTVATGNLTVSAGIISAAGGQITVSGSVTPQIQWSPSSGSTRTGQVYQQGDNWFVATAAVGNRLGVNLNTGDITAFAGHILRGSATQDIGASGSGWRTGYFGTSLVIGTAGWTVSATAATGLTAQGNSRFAHGTSALATTATEGFFHIQSCDGAPTGVPASIPSGQIPEIYDKTNHRIYFYSGSWRSVAVA